jgi:hypothetical protein
VLARGQHCSEPYLAQRLIQGHPQSNAANPEAVSLDETSQRPFQTVIPLSERLGLTPITTYSAGQEAKLVAEILHSSGILLISWEHRAISEKIAPGIAGEQKIEDLPQKWDETRYDVILRFDRISPDAPWSFCQLCPCLMSGDLRTPMAGGAFLMTHSIEE